MEFHLFPRLPVELQKLIWEHAATDAYSIPTAYHANPLKETSTNAPDHPEPFFKYEEGASPLCGLLQTTQHSRSVALKVLPTEPVRLYGKHNQNEEPTEQRVLTGPAIWIDGAKDLVILQQDWVEPTYDYRLVEQPDLTMTYVALPMRNIQGFMSDPAEAIAGIVILHHTYPKTRVFYLLIDPGTLEAARGPWSNAETRRLSLTPSFPPLFTSYVTEYSAGEPHRAFWARRRQYFDIPPENFGPYGGLQSLISRLWEAQLMYRFYGMKYRLMTWRDI